MGKGQQPVALNLLCEGTKIEGDLYAQTDIRIDGHIKGKVETTGRLVIGPSAIVIGQIIAPDVEIQGKVEGDVTSEGNVTLRSKAVLFGSIIASFVSIESGALFNGNCQVDRRTDIKN